MKTEIETEVNKLKNIKCITDYSDWMGLPSDICDYSEAILVRENIERYTKDVRFSDDKSVKDQLLCVVNEILIDLSRNNYEFQYGMDL